jgi:hypothetical protein
MSARCRRLAATGRSFFPAHCPTVRRIRMQRQKNAPPASSPRVSRVEDFLRSGNSFSRRYENVTVVQHGPAHRKACLSESQSLPSGRTRPAATCRKGFSRQASSGKPHRNGRAQAALCGSFPRNTRQWEPLTSSFRSCKVFDVTPNNSLQDDLDRYKLCAMAPRTTARSEYLKSTTLIRATLPRSKRRDRFEFTE